MNFKDKSQQLRERIDLIENNINYLNTKLYVLNKKYRRKCDYPTLFIFCYSNVEALAYEINSVREIKNNLIEYKDKLTDELLKI